MLKLYFAPGACSFVPLAGLEVVKTVTGDEFETQLVKLHKGEQRSPEYLALNPMGQVPVLMVDGTPLTQIVAICEYLDRRYPQANLLPKEATARTAAMSLFAWFNNTVHPTFTHIFMPEKFADGDAVKAELKRFNLAAYRGYLDRIQDLAAKADQYLLGKDLSFLDFYAVTFLRWAGLAGIDPDTFPAYKAYVDRIAALPAVAAVLERERMPLHTFKKRD